MNRTADFFYKTNRFESIRITNRIDSNRELECSSYESCEDGGTGSRSAAVVDSAIIDSSPAQELVRELQYGTTAKPNS